MRRYNGTIFLPCEHDVSWLEISYEQKRIVFKDGDKHGIKDFDGNITKRRAIYFIRCWMCATASAGRQT